MKIRNICVRAVTRLWAEQARD